MSPLSLRVAELRAAKGWNQQELAERAGVNRATIRRIEAGSKRVDFDVLEKLADAFEVDPAVLIQRKPKKAH